MTRLRSVFAVLLTALFILTAAPATAQDEGPFPEFSDLAGLEVGLSRSYSLDFSAFEAVPEGSPDASPEGSPEPAYRDVLNFTGFVLEFDSSDNAGSGYEAFLDHGIEPLQTSLGFDNPTVTEGELTDLGDQAFAYSIFNETESTEGYFRYAFMQQDAYVFVAIIITESEASSLDADALLAHFAEATDEGHSGPGMHDEAGGSSGGLWEFFPAADHELYEGLIPTGDEVFFPVSDGDV